MAPKRPIFQQILFFRLPGKRLLIGLIIGYVLLMAFGRLADRLILFPTTHTIRRFNIERLEIPYPHGIVEAWIGRSDGVRNGEEPVAYVLEFTGNAARAEEMADYSASQWRNRPVELWAVNFPGYGGSTGPATLSHFPEAALAAYDSIKAKANGKPIIVSGTSLGSTCAIYLAANRPVHGVILANPPPLRNLILGRFGWWNLWLLAGPIALQVPDELNSIKNGPKVTAPGIFILSEFDEVVPPQYQEKVFRAYAGPTKRILLHGGGHNTPIDEDSTKELAKAMDWMLEPRP